MGCFKRSNSQISQFCKSRRLFFIVGAIENQKNPKKVRPSIFDFSLMRNAIFCSSTLVHKSPFLRQTERSEHFRLKINFVGQKKLNKYGVLKIHFFQNPRRYKSCPNLPPFQTKNCHPQILTHHMVIIKKSGILYLVLRSLNLSNTVHDYSL